MSKECSPWYNKNEEVSPMNVIITGANGTLAPYIIKVLEKEEIGVHIWDREIVPVDDEKKIDAFIDQVKPDFFLHIATGPIDWLKEIIRSIRRHHIPLVFTSTVSVFSDTQSGPFTVEDKPLSESDYGLYKQACEDYITREYGGYSVILRIGWQIGLEAKKNNMLAYLVNEGTVDASSMFIPATSFMHETAKVITSLLEDFTPGLVQFDQNLDNWSFYEIALKLKDLFGLDITVNQVGVPIVNSRMENTGVKEKALSDTMNQLRRGKV